MGKKKTEGEKPGREGNNDKRTKNVGRSAVNKFEKKVSKVNRWASGGGEVPRGDREQAIGSNKKSTTQPATSDGGNGWRKDPIRET